MKISYRWQPPLRDVLGRFTKLEAENKPGLLEMLNRLGRLFVSLEQSEAPKRTLRFAAGIRYWLFQEGDALGFKVGSPAPLATWIKGGTRPHPIVARRVKFLKFWWDSGPRGAGVYFFRRVNHPGTKANPYHLRAFDAWLPTAQTEAGEHGARLATILGD